MIYHYYVSDIHYYDIQKSYQVTNIPWLASIIM